MKSNAGILRPKDYRTLRKIVPQVRSVWNFMFSARKASSHEDFVILERLAPIIRKWGNHIKTKRIFENECMLQFSFWDSWNNWKTFIFGKNRQKLFFIFQWCQFFLPNVLNSLTVVYQKNQWSILTLLTHLRWGALTAKTSTTAEV